ncbi:MAG: peptidase C69 [Promethearchaeota archaeon]|nr:MAG: peptidase C69 [Candidatus Lokiarchaeota archaeon]
MCDTLVALGNSTKSGHVIFGKNSDRPSSEAQLITYMPAMHHSKAEQIKCTYITIPQVSETYAILMSQPFWMFGCEIGCNEHGVVIGNEAVHTKEPLRSNGLLGMDLLRLGLERAKTAKDALKIITNLLETFGQGGSCSFTPPEWLYHNSYLIADSKEAFILETADEWWIVEKVKDIRSISNNLSIRGKGDLRRKGIIQHAINKGYCNDDDNFDFAMIFSDPQIPEQFSPYTREGCSLQMLNQNKGKITEQLMMEFLREHNVGICMHGMFESTSSQVSVLKDNFKKSIHWFTGSTLPCLSVFKPYIFPIGEEIVLNPGPYTKIDPEWFWTKHSNYVKKLKRKSASDKKARFKEKSREIEKATVEEVRNLENIEENISAEQYEQNFYEINKKCWKQSKALIEY